MVTLPDKTVYDSEVSEQVEETTRRWIERPVLILLEGAGVNRRYRIDKPMMMMGRDLTNDIVLRDTRSSRRHAKLEYKNFLQSSDTQEIILHDMESTNGTFVNGVRITSHPLHDRDKILVGSTLFGFFLRDEAELEADQQLFHLASNDALTSLRNRGVLNMELEKEFDRARRYGRSLSLVMFDIDHFKHFNDTYGHQMGDSVLQEIGRLVKANIRFNDLGARYGGEEFAIILPETAIDGALIQAERLRVAVQNNIMPHDGASISVTISLGIAQLEAGITSVEELIRAADRALYQAKAEGRNCTCWTSGDRINVGCNTQVLQRRTPSE
ncbi:GGDEF domain-containing protein [bacterium]|nr:GGDEF domain-containing protein [bacterium]